MSATDPSTQLRVLAGVHTGGQYATDPRREAAVALVDEATHSSDTVALDEISLILGTGEVSGTADTLEAIAQQVATTGRPHPGNATTVEDDGVTHSPEYDAALAAWASAHRQPADPRAGQDWATLNSLATHLAAMESWSSDDPVDDVATIVDNTGRPHRGGDEATYALALHRWRVREGLEPLTTSDHLDEIADEAGLAHMADVVGIILNREAVPARVLDALTARDIESLHEHHIAPIITEAAGFATEVAAGEHFTGSEYIRPGEGADHARRMGREQGYDSAGEILALAVVEGRVTEDQLRWVHPGDLEDLYNDHLAPAVDRIEQVLAARA